MVKQASELTERSSRQPSGRLYARGCLKMAPLYRASGNVQPPLHVIFRD